MSRRNNNMPGWHGYWNANKNRNMKSEWPAYKNYYSLKPPSKSVLLKAFENHIERLKRLRKQKHAERNMFEKRSNRGSYAWAKNRANKLHVLQVDVKKQRNQLRNHGRWTGWPLRVTQTGNLNYHRNVSAKLNNTTRDRNAEIALARTHAFLNLNAAQNAGLNRYFAGSSARMSSAAPKRINWGAFAR